MKKLAYCLKICLFLFTQYIVGQNYTLVSPNKTIRTIITVSEHISYSIWVDNNLVMDASRLSLTLDNGINLGKKPIIVTAKTDNVNQVLKPVLKVKSKEIQDIYNELTLTFKNKYLVRFRAYNNGIAYQFETKFKEDIIVKDEEATFNFTQNNKTYFPREAAFFSHNERLYEHNALDTLTTKDLASLPTLVSSKNNIKILLTETALLDYPGMWLTGNKSNSLKATFPKFVLKTKVNRFERWKDDRSLKPIQTAPYIAKTKGTRTFPWRIIAIAKNDEDLITNQLSYQLAAPNKIKNTSWIQPGKVAWDWWNDNNIYGVDFKAGINTDTYKYYIDFAAKYGIEYIILDEGWYKLGNVLSIMPEVDVIELINYGKSKNVGLILWIAWSSLEQQLEKALDSYQKWGAKGIKVDFMQRDDQWMVTYYERVAKACADRELLVDFHGSYKPAGLRRTYPNVLTREGVKGAENNKWAKYITPTHNVTLPFIRMVAGPMDYTPGAMRNAHDANFKISWKRPMAKGTRAHQVAMYVVYESPLQMLCDSPSNYLKEDVTTKFIAQIPTIWDETKVLHAKLGEHIALARKYKDTWYIGAMTNETEKELTIDFSFLKKGTYKIEIFKDGTNADRNAVDYKLITKTITSKDTLTAKLAKGGGWSAIIKKQ
ncbi:glycoside hydrolase family 97 protein [Tenacibaculum sp. 190524A02b]|uniref:glycoside hydrolase family 97 protein n=1 Tax=Tenacibaculum vairaonense TaxID=3137860 RepID=UPI0031FB1C32